MRRAQPRWVVAGEPADDGGVTLWASHTLTAAELTREIDFGDVQSQLDGCIYGYRQAFTLTATMPTLVMIHADDWPAAFRRLFDCWTPDPEPRELTP